MKKRIPIYFNKEFLKFNPIMFMIKEFNPILFFVAFPLIGFLIGLFSGLLQQVGFIDANIITDFIKHKTYFDEILAIPFKFVFDLFWTNPNESFFSMAFAYLMFSFIWFFKFMLIYYIYVKFILIFTLSKEELTYDEFVKGKTAQLGGKIPNERLENAIKGSWELTQLMKRY